MFFIIEKLLFGFNPPQPVQKLHLNSVCGIIQKPCHRLCLHKLSWLIQVIVDNGFWIDTERHGRWWLAAHRVHWVDERGRAGLVRLSVDVTSFDASSSDTGCVAVGPVVAAIITITVS